MARATVRGWEPVIPVVRGSPQSSLGIQFHRLKHLPPAEEERQISINTVLLISVEFRKCL